MKVFYNAVPLIVTLGTRFQSSILSQRSILKQNLRVRVFSVVRSTAEMRDLCAKRRELRKKRFEPDGAAKYKEVNNNIKRCMKKAKENWIGEQCSEIKEVNGSMWSMHGYVQTYSGL